MTNVNINTIVANAINAARNVNNAVQVEKQSVNEWWGTLCLAWDSFRGLDEDTLATRGFEMGRCWGSEITEEATGQDWVKLHCDVALWDMETKDATLRELCTIANRLTRGALLPSGTDKMKDAARTLTRAVHGRGKGVVEDMNNHKGTSRYDDRKNETINDYVSKQERSKMLFEYVVELLEKWENNIHLLTSKVMAPVGIEEYWTKTTVDGETIRLANIEGMLTRKAISITEDKIKAIQDHPRNVLKYISVIEKRNKLDKKNEYHLVFPFYIASGVLLHAKMAEVGYGKLQNKSKGLLNWFLEKYDHHDVECQVMPDEEDDVIKYGFNDNRDSDEDSNEEAGEGVCFSPYANADSWAAVIDYKERVLAEAEVYGCSPEDIMVADEEMRENWL